jgi:hypothetical protein
MTSYDASTNIDGGASMGDIGELSARVDLLSGQVEREAVLCASRDRDLSDVGEKLRGQERLLQAVGITQSEHTEQLNALNRKVEVTNSKLGTAGIRIGAIESRVGGIENQVRIIDSKVGTIEAVQSEHGSLLLEHGSLLRKQNAVLQQVLGKLDRIIGDDSSAN